MPDPIQGPSESQRIESQERSEAARANIIQVAVDEAFTAWSDEAAFNPIMMARRFESLDEKNRKQREKTEEKKTDEVRIERVEEISEEFSRNNPELQSRSLLALRARISNKDSAADILSKVFDSYRDYALADEALDFLEATYTHKEMVEKVRIAKANLHDLHGPEVRAGRNMGVQAREFSKQGLGSPTALRELYRDVTGNPREASNLFTELSDKFSYKNMKTVIDFLLHALGADLKSKGPSIATAELHRIMTETRSLQAILGVYKFFQSRMKLMEAAFQNAGLTLVLSFEALARVFVQLIKERYPSMDKILGLANKLNLADEVMAQIIVFTQMRDATRGVAPKLFKSEQHRQDVLLSFLEALEELEDQREDEEEEKE